MIKLLIIFLTTISGWELAETTIDAYVDNPTKFTIELNRNLTGQGKTIKDLKTAVDPCG